MSVVAEGIETEDQLAQLRPCAAATVRATSFRGHDAEAAGWFVQERQPLSVSNLIEEAWFRENSLVTRTYNPARIRNGIAAMDAEKRGSKPKSFWDMQTLRALFNSFRSALPLHPRAEISCQCRKKLRFLFTHPSL